MGLTTSTSARLKYTTHKIYYTERSTARVSCFRDNHRVYCEYYNILLHAGSGSRRGHGNNAQILKNNDPYY